FLLTIYDLNSSNKQNIMNGYAIIVAKSLPFNSGGISEIATGIISYNQFLPSSAPDTNNIFNLFGQLFNTSLFWIGIGTVILLILIISASRSYSKKRKKKIELLNQEIQQMKKLGKQKNEGV
ncbi:MAG: hypothetical protein ACP5L4_07405, partial [Thermoplasmata archaeon]